MNKVLEKKRLIESRGRIAEWEEEALAFGAAVKYFSMAVPTHDVNQKSPVR
ncbi:hypothetical protein [Burkholderia ubonensis]|uniref:hypothetical protein n=1 Tax=Burkholderia ubonensis TaxID=101571 RepID=UPI0012F9E207|nr:hypothetical protein [Burkholderia ubonensis]